MAFERKSYQEYRRQNTGSVNNGGTQTNTQPDSTVKFKRKSYHEYLNSESKTDLAGFDSYQQWLNHAHQAISDYNQLAEKAKDYDSGKKFSAYQAQNAARFGNLRNEWNQQRDAIDNLIATGGISSEQGQAYKKQAKEIAGILSNMAKDTSAADYWKQWESEADYAATQEQQRIAGLDMESLNRKLEELDRTISKLRRNGAGYDYQANPQAYETYWRQVGELEQIRTQTKKDREALGTYQQQQKSAEAAQKEAERIAGLDMESLQRIREIYTENRNRIEQEKLQYDTISQQEQIDGLIRKQELNQQQLDEVNRDIYARERYEKGLEYQRIYETRKEDAYLPGLKDRTYQLVNGTWTNLKENLYSGMEEAERQIYNTIVAQQGLTKGEEYLEWLKPELNRRYAAQMHERLADTANAHPIAGMMMNVGAGLWKPLGYGYTAVQNIANRVNNEYQPIDPNAGWFAPNIASEATTEGLTRDMSDAGKFLTQTGLSIAQNLCFMGFGEATSLALMGLGSASDTSREILQRGGSNEQAAWGGAAAGAAEVLFEKVSLDSLIRLKDTDNLRDAIGNILKQAGVEASEEAFTELTNNLSDQLINGGLSNYQQAVQRYMAQGMEEAEAKKAASAEIAGEIGLAALGGALSGGVLAGGKTVMQYNGGQQNILQERERENRALQEDARARYEAAKKQVEAAQASAQAQDTAAAQQSKTGEAAGRTEVTYRADGARTEATGIDRIEANGKTYVKTADGNTTALEELSFAEERMGMLYENAELFGTEGGRAYVSGYDGRDIGIYTNGWAGVYNRAANGSSEAAAVKYGKEAGLSEAQALSAYYSGRNSYAAGESKHGLPETEPVENREEEAIGSRIKYSIKTESIEAIERKNYERWQAVKAATRRQSMDMDITDDRNVARYRNEVDEAMRDEKTRNVMLGMPNELLLKAGFANAPIMIDASNLTKIAYPYGYLGNTDGKNRHDLGFSVIKNLIYQIAKPLAITENVSDQMKKHAARGESSRILFTEWVDQKNHRVIIPVSISKGNVLSIENNMLNEVKSAFGAEERYLEQLKDVKVIYPENEKDVRALIQSARQQSVPESISDDIFAKSILYSKDFSNTNIRQKGKKDTTLRKEKFAGETNGKADGLQKFSVKYLEEHDLQDYLKTGKRLNRAKTEALAQGKKILLTSETDMTEYIRQAIAGERLPTAAYAMVGSRLAADVREYSNGKIDISGAYMELVANDIKHAYEEHLEAKEDGNIDLSIEDYLNIANYVDSYDSLIYAIHYKNGNMRISLQKTLENGELVIIEAGSKSRNSIQFKNMIGVSSERFNRDYAKYKKGSNLSSRGSKSSTIPLRNSTTSNNRITQGENTVNPNIRQKGKKDTALRKEKFAGETKRLVHHYSGTLTAEQQDTLRILDIAAQVLDRTVYIEDSIDGEIAGQRAERGANAYFDPRDNSYHLALDATQQGYLTIMLHEAVHDIAANNRAGYEQLAEVVMKYLQEEKAQEQVREDILRYEQRGYREAEEIEEELVANAVGVILNDRRTAEEFAKRFLARDTKVRKAFMRILDNLREYLKRTIAAIKGEVDFRQTELLEKRAGAIEEIRQAMFDAMEGLQNNGQAETTSKKAKKLSPRLETDFAEKYSIDIQANRNEIAQMEAVAKLTGNEFAKSEISLPDMIAAYFSKIGNSVHHALLGDIVLDRRGIKDDIAHGIGRRKAAAFMAIPEVIRNGKIVDIRYDWKNRGYDTVILAAPIKIGTESYLMGVVVNKNVETDRLYVHEVLAINKEGQQSLFKTGGPVKNGVNPGSEAAPSVISILQNILNDNPSIRENEGNDAKEYSEKEKQTLTEEEEYAIRSYKSGLTSYLLNEKLYSGAELSEADMYLMKEIDSALDKLPVYEGKTYRNITFYRQGRAARNAFLNMHVPNTMITYDAYTSSSKAVDGYMLEGDNVVHIEIDGHSGRDISASSLGSTVEQEVLYRRESMFFVDEVTIAEDGNPKIILQEVAENGLERRGDTDSGERGAAMRVMQELHSPESSVQGISEQDTGRNFERESGSSLAIQGGQRDFIRSGRSGTSPDGAVREAYGEIEKDDADKKKYSLKSTETAYEEWEVQTALYDALDHADTGFDNLIRVGPMPHYITNLLGIEGDFFIQRNHAYENMVSQKQALQDGRPVTNRGKDVHFHALGLERMTDAIMGLENPIITMKTKNNDGNPTIIMMLHERGTDGNPLSAIFSFYANKTENGKRERRPHVVLTIAERNMQRKANDGRAAWSEIIQNAIDNGNILDINEKRDVPPVIANTTSVGNITTTSLNENVAQFRQEIKAFKEKNKIRYSLKSTEAAVIIQPNDEQQAEQLEKLRSTLDRQYRLKAGRQMTREAAEKLAGRAIRRFHSGYAAEKLAADLQTIFDEAGRNFDADIFLAEGARAMKGVLAESSTFDKAAYAQYAPVRELLKQKMTLTETQKEEAAAIFGSYGEYRRQLFGSTSLGPGGTSLDIAWQELHRLAPELFPAESTEGDMVSALYDAVQAVKKENFYVNEFAMNLDEAATVAFADLYAEYADLTPIKMLARQMELYAKRYARESEREAGQRQRLRQEEEKRDYESLKQKRKEEQKKITRWEAQRKAELREQNSRIRALQAQKQEAMGGMQRYALDAEITRLEDVKAEIDARYDRMIRNERTLLEEMGKALEKAAGSSTRLAADARQQMLYGKTAAKMAENRQKQAATRKRQAVRRKIGALMHTISAGTDAKHIPEALRNTVAEFLQKIDPGFREDSKAAWKWREQTAVLAARMEEYNLSGGQMQVDAYIIAQLRTIGEDIAARIQTAGSSIREMKLTELQKLDETLDLLGAAIRNSDRILAEERSTRLAAVAQQSMEELRQRKAYQGRMKGMNELLNLQQLDAFSFAEKLGPAFQNSIFKNLRSGLDHKIQMLQEASAAMEQAAEQLPGKRMRDKLKALSGEQANTTIFTLENGTQIRLTTGQIMELYLLNQREAGRRHIYRGGITVEEYTAGRRKVKKQSRKQVSEADIDAITEMLTPAQKRFAEMLQHFCATTGSEWGNRVSLSLWGIKKFTDQRYWPIRVDNNTLETNTMPVDASSIARLKNIGMSQSTNPGAGNALILGDVIDTYIRHMDDMTSYAAYVLPLEDAQRWLNYHGEDGTTMKESVEKALGRGGVDYLKDFLETLNGGKRKGDSAPNWYNRLMRNYKIAAVAANLRVVIQQPSAYARAAAEIAPKYLLHAGKSRAQQESGMRMAQRYAPIFAWKQWGFRDTFVAGDLRSIMVGDRSFYEQIIQQSGALAGLADDMTWGALWNACAAEIRDTTTLEEGTEAFNRRVGERFGEVIDKTQVVDSPFHRSMGMRSGNNIWKTMTAFMSEPIKSYNMLYRAVADLRQSGWKDKAAWQRAVRSGTAFAAQNIINSLLAAVIDVFRDDDRDETLAEKYFGHALENFLEGINPLETIPLAGDLLESLAPMLEGENPDFSNFQSDLGYEGLANLLTAAYDLYNSLGDYKKNDYYAIYKLISALGQVMGIPIGNAWRMVNSILQTAGVEITPYTKLATPYTAAEHAIKEIEAGRSGQATVDAYAEARGAEMLETQPEKYTDIQSAQNFAGNEVYRAMAILLSRENEAIPLAYAARERADTAEVDRIRAELTAKGYPAEVVDEAILIYASDMQEQKAYGEKEYQAQFYHTRHLEKAIDGGNLQDIRNIRAELIRDSTAQDPTATVDQAGLSYVRQQYLQAYESGASTQGLKRIATEIFGATEEQLQNWLLDDRSGDFYTALEAYDTTAANRSIAQLKELGREEKSITTSVTRKYREKLLQAYQSGEMGTVNRLMDLLHGLALYDFRTGEPYYSYERMWGWLEAEA